MNNIKKALDAYKYAYALYTDCADFITDKSENICEETLLEIRCFDESGEYRAFRDTLDEPFCEREITTENEPTYADGSYDEAQYLDVDDKKTVAESNGRLFALGGGNYRLPNDARRNKMLLVRNYYNFDNDGIAYKFDWRLVSFTNEETVGKGEN